MREEWLWLFADPSDSVIGCGETKRLMMNDKSGGILLELRLLLDLVNLAVTPAYERSGEAIRWLSGERGEGGIGGDGGDGGAALQLKTWTHKSSIKE